MDDSLKKTLVQSGRSDLMTTMLVLALCCLLALSAVL